MAKTIKIDESFIKDVQGVLNQLRAQINQVKSGVNAGDTSHTHGGHFNSLTVAAGGDKFDAGTSLKNRISSLGNATDQKLTSFDQKFSNYSQGLDHILASSDATEAANKSYAAFEGYLNGSGTGAIPPPATH